MRYRKLGTTGFSVSEVGFGAWGIGKGDWVGADDAESLRTLHTARDAGINFFDTALAYGNGHSESLIARAFGNSRETIVASKVPPQKSDLAGAGGQSMARGLSRRSRDGIAGIHLAQSPS